MGEALNHLLPGAGYIPKRLTPPRNYSAFLLEESLKDKMKLPCDIMAFSVQYFLMQSPKTVPWGPKAKLNAWRWSYLSTIHIPPYYRRIKNVASPTTPFLAAVLKSSASGETRCACILGAERA
jgi:hypothetical protein